MTGALPAHIAAVADQPIPEHHTDLAGTPDLRTATPLAVMLAELAKLRDDEVEYLDSLNRFTLEMGVYLLARYSRDGELVLTGFFPCDAQSLHRDLWTHHLIKNLRAVEGREALLLRGLIDAGRVSDERPANPRATTSAVRDFVRSGGRLLIDPQGRLSEGDEVPRAWLHGTDEDRVECLRAGRAYYAARERWRGDRQIKRAVRMLGKPTPDGWLMLGNGMNSADGKTVSAAAFATGQIAALCGLIAQALVADPDTAHIGEALEGLGALARKASNDLCCVGQSELDGVA